MSAVEPRIESVCPSTWKSLLERSGHDIHKIYQTAEWANLMRRCYGLEPRFMTLLSGSEPVGGQLFFRRSVLGAFSSYESHGGPVVTDPKELETIEETVLESLRSASPRGLYFITRPNLMSDTDTRYVKSGFIKNEFYTILVDISPGEEGIWGNLHKHARNGIRKAEKNGILVKESQDWENWEMFHRLHVSHSRNRRISPKSLDFFRGAHELSSKGLSKLFLSFEDDRLTGGMLFLAYDGTMSFYISAVTDDVTRCSPSDYIMWTAIRWGVSSELSTLDMGDTWPSPKSHLYGIHRFKEKWGGRLIRRSFYINGWFYRLGRSVVLNSPGVQYIYEGLHERRLV